MLEIDDAPFVESGAMTNHMFVHPRPRLRCVHTTRNSQLDILQKAIEINASVGMGNAFGRYLFRDLLTHQHPEALSSQADLVL